MNGWNEDSFLESMMPLLREMRKGDGCPDAAMHAAVRDGTASPSEMRAMLDHVSQCPSCAELQHRLRLFEAAAPEIHDGEWRRVEARLDAWMETLPGLHAVLDGRKPAERPSSVVSWQQLLSGLLSSWRFQAAAATTFAVVVASLVYLTLLRHPANRAVEVATQSAPASAQPVYRSASPAVTPVPTAVPPKAVHKRSPEHNSVPAPTKRPAETAEPPWEAPGETNATMAAESPTPAVSGESPTQSVLPQQPPGTEVASNGQTPPAPHAPQIQPVPRRSTQAVLRPAHGFGGGMGFLPRPMAAAPASPLPAIVQIEKGTRIWITLAAPVTQSEKSFEFEGSLLLPVSQGGVVFLDRGTTVRGSASVAGGRISIQIEEFVIRGVRYRPVAGLTQHAEAAGGPSTSFDAGQVLEMFTASTATYQRVSGDSVQGNSQDQK